MLLARLADEDFPRRGDLDALGGRLLGLELAASLLGFDEEGSGEDGGGGALRGKVVESFFFFGGWGGVGWVGVEGMRVFLRSRERGGSFDGGSFRLLENEKKKTLAHFFFRPAFSPFPGPTYRHHPGGLERRSGSRERRARRGERGLFRESNQGVKKSKKR